MKDAYPMDYNDKSMLLGLINSIAKKVVPALDVGFKAFSLVPGNPWAGVGALGHQLTSAYMRKRTPKKEKKASAAAKALEDFYLNLPTAQERLALFRSSKKAKKLNSPYRRKRFN